MVADLAHLCEVSGRAATIHADRVPLSPSTRSALTSDPALLAAALTGGDDYEIVFTVKPEDREALLASGADVTEIGRLTPEGVPGTVTVLDGTGAPVPFAARGWSHF